MKPSFRSLATASRRAAKPIRAGAEHGQRGRLDRAEVAADHAQGRHPGQLQHRRQAEAEQQGEADAGTEQGRPEAGRRQHRLDQAGEQPDEHVVDGEAEGEPGHARQAADEGELDEVLRRDGPLRQAEHAQHRAVVQVARREVARGDGHGDGGEQRRQQGDEVEELLGAVERLPHSGRPLASDSTRMPRTADFLISASAHSTNSATLASLPAPGAAMASR
jgi:hypothetical protein